MEKVLSGFCPSQAALPRGSSSGHHLGILGVGSILVEEKWSGAVAAKRRRRIMRARSSTVRSVGTGGGVVTASLSGCSSSLTCDEEEVKAAGGALNWRAADSGGGGRHRRSRYRTEGKIGEEKTGVGLRDDCEVPPHNSGCSCASVSGESTAFGFPDMKLHFLDEADETVLSKRMIRLSRSNKTRSALELFLSMDSAGIAPNPHACNSLLACILRNGSLDDALRVFELMRKKHLATGHTYSLILKAVAGEQGCSTALDMFLRFENEGTAENEFDVVVYNTIISVCGKVKNWIQAEKIWRTLKESGLAGTALTYSLLVSTFVQCGQTELALDAYCEMIQNGHEPGEDVMKAIIASCTKEGKWALALNALNRMLDNDMKPSIIVFNAVINCLGKAGEDGLAFRTYDLLKSSGHDPDTYTWNALLNALYRSKHYADCLKLFESVDKENNSKKNIHLCNTALMSCQKLGLWERSLQILWEMEGSGMQISTASYSLVIGACETARKPRVALQVYQHMIHRKHVPDTFTHLTLIRVCLWGSLWTEVEHMLEHVQLDSSLYNALVQGFCLRGKIALAKKVYSKMRSSGFKPDGKTRAMILQHIADDSVRRHPRYVVKGRN